MLEKNLFITQNSYYFVHKHFLKFFESKNNEVIFVSEKKRGIKKKYLEIIRNFGIRNFIKIIFYELIYSIILRKRKKLINAFVVSDKELNQFLEDLINKNRYNLIISIGCPCLIKSNFENYKKPIYNLHGGIIPFQKGRFSPLKSLQKDNKFLGSTIHEIDNYFDAGKIISQDYFEITNKDKLYNYNNVLKISSELMSDFILNKFKYIPNNVLEDLRNKL